MKKLQLPLRLTITAIKKSDWNGQLCISPIPWPDQPAPSYPGPKVGDLLLESNPDQGAKLMVSLGSAEKVRANTLRQAGESCAKWLIEHQAQGVGLPSNVFDGLGIQLALDMFCEGLLYGAFSFDLHKTTVQTGQPIDVQILCEGETDTMESRLKRVTATMKGVNLAREWSHEPANIINPITLGERARAMAEESGLQCTLLEEQDLKELGAGAILSVGLGSKTPSQLIILEHPGRGDEKEAAPVVIAGKAITFDTGGYSLKDKTGMQNLGAGLMERFKSQLNCGSVE
jgi:leucyl aminopeptidase